MTYYRAKRGHCPHCGSEVPIHYYHAGYGTWKCSACHRTGYADDFPGYGLTMKPGEYEIVRSILRLYPNDNNTIDSTIQHIDWAGEFKGTYYGPIFESVEEAEKWCTGRDIPVQLQVMEE